MNQRHIYLVIPFLTLFISACSVEAPSNEDNTQNYEPISSEEAARFAHRVSFGMTASERAQLEQQGYQVWLDNQFKRRGTSLSDHLTEANRSFGTLGESSSNRQLQAAWWKSVLKNPDQLRQRTTFALSQIFVVSTSGAALTSYREQGLADYYDMLSRNAFGNFRTLLEEMTLHPIMGRYLNMFRNRKPNPDINRQPDENYAREIMQLFTVGLVELNLDGSEKLGLNGQSMATYSQADVEGLAHVFTGWTAPGANQQGTFWPRDIDPIVLITSPMEAYEKEHDSEAKTIIGGVNIPAGLSAREELDIALDTLFNHPNVGPFLGKQLIQRLVTSNPSPAYVERVALAFNDNGQGVRGDLKAVVQAILMDEEAMNGHQISPATFGKLKEPIIRQAAFWRAFNARSQSGIYDFSNAKTFFNQAALNSDTVFNFFRPDHQQGGDLSSNNLVAPEFQITNSDSMTNFANAMHKAIKNSPQIKNDPNPNDILIDLSQEFNLASTPSELIDHLNNRLLDGTMTATMRSELISHLEDLREDRPQDRVYDAIYMIMTSADHAIQQ